MRLKYLILYAAMLVASLLFQFAKDDSVSIRDAGEAAATAAVLTIVIALVIRYLDRRRRE